MQELSTLRTDWEEIEEIETRLLQQMTVQESLRHQLDLQIAFEKQLQETASLFAGERRAALAELQIRLQRLAEWQTAHGKIIPVHPGDSKSPK